MRLAQLSRVFTELSIRPALGEGNLVVVRCDGAESPGVQLASLWIRELRCQPPLSGRRRKKEGGRRFRSLGLTTGEKETRDEVQERYQECFRGGVYKLLLRNEE